MALLSLSISGSISLSPTKAEEAMAAISHVVALAAVALCLSSLLGSANCHGDNLQVTGKVVCDPCRVSFETTVSYPLEGSLVKLECKNRTSGVFTYATEAKTDASGAYQLLVVGDHEEEICEVRAVNSGDPKCSSLVPEAIRNARISLTKNSGVANSIRYANALYFAPEKSLENCPQILFDMGIPAPGTQDQYY